MTYHTNNTSDDPTQGRFAFTPLLVLFWLSVLFAPKILAGPQLLAKIRPIHVVPLAQRQLGRWIQSYSLITASLSNSIRAWHTTYI